MPTTYGTRQLPYLTRAQLRERIDKSFPHTCLSSKCPTCEDVAIMDALLTFMEFGPIAPDLLPHVEPRRSQVKK